MNIAIACSKDWFKLNLKSKNKKKIYLLKKKRELSLSKLNQIKPDYIFIPHWNWKIPKNIFQKFNCIGFHTSPLPYGRGGSPIQNLILEEYKKSPVCAFKVTENFDEGDIYITKMINLNGSLFDIFERINEKVNYMIEFIIKNNPKPKKQKGKIKYFKRLNANHNNISNFNDLTKIYDVIRMVDGPGYSPSFIKFKNIKIEFYNAKKVNKQKLVSSCSIKYDN